jgi:hypothetical protein
LVRAIVGLISPTREDRITGKSRDRANKKRNPGKLLRAGASFMPRLLVEGGLGETSATLPKM